MTKDGGVVYGSGGKYGVAGKGIERNRTGHRV